MDKPRRKWLKISLVFLALASIITAWFSFQLKQIDACGIGAFGITFLDTQIFQKIITATECSEALDNYFVSDIIFLIAYSITLIFWVPTIKRPRYKLMVIILGSLLAISDLTENLLYLSGNINSHFVSATKVLIASFLLGYVGLQYITNARKERLEIVKTIWHNRFSILAVLITALLVFNPQGKELFLFLLEKKQSFPDFFILNILIILVGTMIWYLPRFMYKFKDEQFKRMTGSSSMPNMNLVLRADNWNYDNLITEKEAEKQKTINIRRRTPYILGGIYFLLIAVFFIVTSLTALTSPPIEINNLAVYLELGSVLIIGIGALLLNQNSNGNKLKQRLKSWQYSSILFAIILFPALVSIIANISLDSTINDVNIEMMLLQSVLGISYLIGFLFLAYNRNSNLPQILHIALFVLAAFFTVYFILNIVLGELMSAYHLNGLTIGFIFITSYYLTFWLLSDKQFEKKRTRNYLSITVFFFIFSIFLSTRIDNNHLDLSPVSIEPQTSLPNLDAYTSARIQEIKTGYKNGDSIPIFLIAANGGGTMQAYWTASILSRLESATSGRFMKHTFAMSGASGGAVGMGIVTTLLADTNIIEPNQIDDIYKTDYLSGGLMYLLGRDLLYSAVPFNLDSVMNRNSWLTAKYSESLKKITKSDDSYWDERMDVLYHENPHLPIYLANITHVESGSRYVGSAFHFGNDHTGTYLCELMSKNNEGLTLGQVATLTNRFPYVNTSAKIKEYGHFVDGGYYDNSGLETISAVHNYLKSYISNNPDSIHFQIHVIHINFTQDAFFTHLWPEAKNTLSFRTEINEVILPASTAYKSLLYGQVNNRILQVKNNFDSKFHQIYLTPPELYETNKLQFPIDQKNNFYLRFIKNPLARTISQNQKNYVRYVLEEEWDCNENAQICLDMDKKKLTLLAGNKVNQLIQLIGENCPN